VPSWQCEPGQSASLAHDPQVPWSVQRWPAGQSWSCQQTPHILPRLHTGLPGRKAQSSLVTHSTQLPSGAQSGAARPQSRGERHATQEGGERDSSQVRPAGQGRVVQSAATQVPRVASQASPLSQSVGPRQLVRLQVWSRHEVPRGQPAVVSQEPDPGSGLQAQSLQIDREGQASLEAQLPGPAQVGAAGAAVQAAARSARSAA
jgi:hypothetical protein